MIPTDDPIAKITARYDWYIHDGSTHPNEVRVLVEDIEVLLTLLDKETTKGEITLYWLLTLFKVHNREGWEAGPTEDEIRKDIADALSNIGLDPYAEDGKVETFLRKMQTKPRRELFAWK